MDTAPAFYQAYHQFNDDPTVQFGKLETKKHPNVAYHYGITEHPTIMWWVRHVSLPNMYDC